MICGWSVRGVEVCPQKQFDEDGVASDVPVAVAQRSLE